MAQTPRPKDPPRPSDDRSPKKDRAADWIDSLASRSTGLPGMSGSKTPPSSDGKSAWAYAGLGLQFAGTTALFAVMGYFLDRYMGWTPWGTVALTMLGLVGGLYLLIKEALKDNKDPTPPAQKRGKP